MKVSVVICTFQRPDDLCRLLDSVVQQTLLPSEIVIVDQSADDQTQRLSDEFARRRPPGIDRWIYIREHEKGLVRARNRGVSQANGDIVSFVDDDVVLFNDYLEVVCRYFENPNIGGVTGSLVVRQPPSGWKWQLRKFLLRIFLLNSFDGRMTASGFGYPISEREVTELMELELFGGYSMNFRRELTLQELSDEWFEGYSFREDVDLSYRISRRSRLVQVPDAKFYHNHSSVNRLDVRQLKLMQFRNYRYLFRKFRSQTLLHRFLFAYSVFGIVLIDFLEFLFNRNRARWAAVAADMELIFGRELHDETT
jgi:GT2 family glycosyltransferase